MGMGETETAAEVARQIRILLTGLAARAERSGLLDLAVRLRAVAAEAERLSRST